MKVIKQKINRRGKHEVTVELDKDEKLMLFKDDRYYRLGGQVEDVVQGHVITECEGVYWCNVTQEWRA